MAVELKFHRVDNTPWGFRLTGGADLDMPIMVIKVNEGSIAEDAGMKVGDFLVRIDDNCTAGLTHLQVHDLIIDAGNTFVVAVRRGELPQYFTESEETIDTETSHAGLSQSLQINIKTNVVDTTEIIVETGEVVEQNIKINGEIVSDKEDVNVDLNSEEKISEEVMQVTGEKQSSNALGVTFMPTVKFIKDSEVLKVINEEKTETTDKKKGDEKRWTTFLQKPIRPKPKIKQKESDESKNEYEEHVLLTRLLSLVQEPPYRVIITRHKKKVDAEKALALESDSQQSTPNPDELISAASELSMTPDPEHEMAEEEEEKQQETEKYEESEQQTAEYEEREEQVISEVEMSLEEQLGAIQKQLLALSQLPAAIQQTLDVVTQQLTKIVGPVNDPNVEENEDEDNEVSILEDTEGETEERTAELETVEEISEGGFERDSYQGDREEDGEREQDQEDDQENELEMLQPTPEPEEFLTPEEREERRMEQEKMDKKQKDKALLEDLRQRRLKERPTYPLTPLQRPICLPGGRRWHMPDDAQPTPRHPNMSDDLIAETISAQSEIIIGTTLGDSNTHLVASKVTETKKINFLKYQPPPQTLDHLKHSEVYRLVHDMEPPTRGVQSRQGKAMAEEDYYAQIQKNSQEGVAQQTKG